MTNYHPDVQRAYESHCADGYVVPDDETGPLEATGATESDETRVQAHGDGVGLREAVEALADEWEADGPMCAFWGAHMRLRMVLAAHAAPAGDARGALAETLDDLTRTLARAEKAEAEVARYQRLVSWHERHGSDAEARARRAEDWQREVCDMLGYEPDGADEVLTYLPAWRAEASAKDEEIARLRHSADWAWRCSNSHAERAEKAEAERDAWRRTAIGRADGLVKAGERLYHAEAERDRARDTAAALEVEVARLTAKVERLHEEVHEGNARGDSLNVEVVGLTGALWGVVREVRRGMENYCTSTQNEGFEVALNIIRAALSDTTGEATR